MRDAEQMADLIERAIREYADESGYGQFITDALCSELAEKIVGVISETKSDD